MQCQNCGHNNQSTARFCANCGNQLSVGRAALHAGQLMSGGTYRVVRPLGKGGMGAIYLAEDLKAFKRLCVIKEMLDYFNPADPTEAQKAHQRFEDEARTLADLNHPGIPKIYTYFSEAGRNYIVMEYVEGQDLMQGLTHEDEQRKLVPGQPYPVDKVLAWGIELCRVLEYLARRQDPRTGQPRPVVHHDIKPANVILDHNSGAPRLVDFGTAKARLLVQPGGGVGLQKSSVYGTAGYAPPEQYQAQSEARSDVFALAVTMYHLLTDDDPRPHPFDFPQWGRVPAEVGRVLAPALEQNVQQRPTAAQLRQELEKLVAPQGAAQPFTFRSGEQARTPAELVPLCDKYWDEGRGYLYGGQFAQWFSSLNRHDLTAKVDAIVKRSGDQDAGLEEFLHVLDPNLPAPQPQIMTKQLDFGALAEGQTKQLTLTVRNAGRGYAVVNLCPTVKWLTVNCAAVGLRAGQREDVAVTADASKMPPGQARGVVEVGMMRIPATARLSVWRTLWARYPVPIMGAVATTVVLMIVALYAGWRAWDTMSHYRAGVEYFSAGQWAQARGELAQVPDYKDAAELIQESYYRPGVAYLDAGEWAQARGELGQVRGYKDTNDKLRDILLRSVEMVEVPAGEFPMGSNDGGGDEKPVHTVYLDAFRIDKYEVTNAQYRECLEAGACREPRYWDARRFNAPLQPVVGVDWEQARTYCEWAGKRLPTEAEWEKAARGTDGRKYPWGNDAPNCSKAQYYACDGDTVAVGSKPAGTSPYGAEDMAGNVWEWTADWYDSDYYASAPARNPTGPASGSAKVVRGGDWNYNAQNIRTANRINYDPSNSYIYCRRALCAGCFSLILEYCLLISAF